MPISKSQAKKLAKIEEAKRQKARRAEVLAKLQQVSGSVEHLRSLRQSGRLGQAGKRGKTKGKKKGSGSFSRGHIGSGGRGNSSVRELLSQGYAATAVEPAGAAPAAAAAASQPAGSASGEGASASGDFSFSVTVPAASRTPAGGFEVTIPPQLPPQPAAAAPSGVLVDGRRHSSFADGSVGVNAAGTAASTLGSWAPRVQQFKEPLLGEERSRAAKKRRQVPEWLREQQQGAGDGAGTGDPWAEGELSDVEEGDEGTSTGSSDSGDESDDYASSGSDMGHAGTAPAHDADDEEEEEDQDHEPTAEQPLQASAPAVPSMFAWSADAAKEQVLPPAERAAAALGGFGIGDGELSDDAASDDDDDEEEEEEEEAAATGSEEQAVVAGGKRRRRPGADDREVGDAVAAPLGSRAGATAAARGRVQPDRPQELQVARMKLPVCGMEQEVMETVGDADVLILSGETGSGKTTQVPQFLFEAGYGQPAEAGGRPGMIGVTQPRRVAAVSVCKRVREELGLADRPRAGGQVVAHQVRYDSKSVGRNTVIKFMTDGVLLREVREDILLRKYSAIVIDEAHERGVNTDVLIGLLSRALPLRNRMAKQEMEAFRATQRSGKRPRSTGTGAAAAELSAPSSVLRPLKLIIMSATLRTQDFTANAALFPTPPPVLNVPGRQHPVTTHFSKKTELKDYVSAMEKSVVRIHERLPPGGVLVFATGQEEVETLVRRLADKFGPRAIAREKKRRERQRKRREQEQQRAAAAAAAVSGTDEAAGPLRLTAGGVRQAEAEETEGEKPAGDETEEAEEEDLPMPMHVLPLYALLPRRRQLAVFKPPPEGARLVVVATNIAETSITIPGMRYVVDSGRVKRRVFHASGGSTFEVGWISKAAAEQRAGRAGRTGPGHCYRLYSSAVFGEKFPPFDRPEMVRMPVDQVALHLLSIGIEDVAKFPFPTPPPRRALRRALRGLVAMGAADWRGASAAEDPGLVSDSSDEEEAGGKAVGGAEAVDRDEEPTGQPLIASLTPLGEAVASLPLRPSLGKALALGVQQARVEAQAHARAGNGRAPDERRLWASMREGAGWRTIRMLCAAAAAATVDRLLLPTAQLSKVELAEVNAAVEAEADEQEERAEDGAAAGQDGVGGGDDDWGVGGVAAGSDWAEAAKAGTATDDYDGTPGAAAGASAAKESTEQQQRRLEERRARAARRAARDKAQAAQASLLRPSGDLLTGLAILRAHAAASFTDRATGGGGGGGGDGSGTAKQCAALGMHLGASAAWCREHCVREKAILEATQLRAQLEQQCWRLVGDGIVAAGGSRPAVAEADLAVAEEEGAEEGSSDDEEATAAPAKAKKGAVKKGRPPPSRFTVPFIGSFEPAHTTAAAAAGADEDAAQAAEQAIQAATQRARQLLIAGSIGRIVRKSIPEDAGAGSQKRGKRGGRKPKPGALAAGARVPYTSTDPALPAEVFVHPSSAACAASAEDMPDFLAFAELVTTGKPYLRCCEAVPADWVAPLAEGTPLLSHNGPLPSPAPGYDPQVDAVTAAFEPRYSASGAGGGGDTWRLPLQLLPLQGGAASRSGSLTASAVASMAVPVFARALLEGRVLPSLRAATANGAAGPQLGANHLALQPSILATRTGQLQRRSGLLIQRLLAGAGGERAPVLSREALVSAWRRDPTFLRTELLGWCTERGQKRLTKRWEKWVARAAK